MSEYLIIALLVIAAVVVIFFVVKSRKGKAAENAGADAPMGGSYAAVAQGVLKAVGGKENVTHVDYCATRLRFELKSYAAVDEAAVKAAGATGIIRPGKNVCQVIIGTKVQLVYDELKKLL